MSKIYYVMSGNKRTHGFRNKSRAVLVAKKIREKNPRRELTVEEITSYGRVKPGETDWSQKTVKVIRKKKR